MGYIVKFAPSADRDMGKLAPDIRKRIYSKTLKLGNNPRPAGVEKLKGFDKAYRIRVGDYRIVYEIEDDVLYVVVIRIGHRREIYRRL